MVLTLSPDHDDLALSTTGHPVAIHLHDAFINRCLRFASSVLRVGQPAPAPAPAAAAAPAPAASAGTEPGADNGNTAVM